MLNIKISYLKLLNDSAYADNTAEQIDFQYHKRCFKKKQTEAGHFTFWSDSLFLHKKCVLYNVLQRGPDAASQKSGCARCEAV